MSAVQSFIYVYEGIELKSRLQHKLQHNCPTTCITAPQKSSTTFDSLHVYSQKEAFSMHFKNVIMWSFLILKLCECEIV
jgi:hypothetical protein